ncbi:MAG: ATPase [Rhodobacteraceae bacterium]|nr:ATPase [Paracoccaceae bacterium]
MAFHLGVDGGGSGCRAAVADAAGRIVGRGAAGPANIASDPDGAAANILAAARAALAEAGEGAVAAAGLGLAGANAAGAVARLRAALPFARVTIETDAVAATLGALGTADGIVAALGTGSVYGVQRAGRVRQIGGWGLVLGDEGSGAWIGRAVLARALRAVDGFVARTPLLDALLVEFGGPDGIAAFAVTARPADFAALAPRVAAGDDPAAAAVMARATADVARAIDLLQRAGALPVVFLGGLGAVHAARLAGRWERREAAGSALDGALMLARRAG